MNANEAINNAVKHLHSGRPYSRAIVIYHVILPILNSLGWSDKNYELCILDYRVDKSQFEKSYIDFALMRYGEPGSDEPMEYIEPQVFVEVKCPGSISSGSETQLFELASNMNVPFVILTDGQHWEFYICTTDRGNPSECKFFTMELLHEFESQEYAVTLNDVLSKDNVVSGEAVRIAESMLPPEPREYFQVAWEELLSKYEGLLKLLVELLGDQVEKKIGQQPKCSDVENFLRNCKSPPPPETRTLNLVTEQGKIVGYKYRGKLIRTTTAIDALIQILRKFYLEDPNLMETFANQTAGKKRKRKLVSKNKWELYPGRRDLVLKHSKELPDGWWIGTNMSKRQIITAIRTACDIWGVKWKCTERKT